MVHSATIHRMPILSVTLCSAKTVTAKSSVSSMDSIRKFRRKSRNGPCVHNHDINFEVCISDEKDGIWYSGIVAYGKEYVFSQLGVESVSPVRNPDFTLRKLDNNRHI